MSVMEQLIAVMTAPVKDFIDNIIYIDNELIAVYLISGEIIYFTREINNIL